MSSPPSEHWSSRHWPEVDPRPSCPHISYIPRRHRGFFRTQLCHLPQYDKVIHEMRCQCEEDFSHSWTSGHEEISSMSRPLQIPKNPSHGRPLPPPYHCCPCFVEGQIYAQCHHPSPSTTEEGSGVEGQMSGMRGGHVGKCPGQCGFSRKEDLGVFGGGRKTEHHLNLSPSEEDEDYDYEEDAHWDDGRRTERNGKRGMEEMQGIFKDFQSAIQRHSNRKLDQYKMTPFPPRNPPPSPA